MSKKILLASVSILLFGLQTVVAQEDAVPTVRDTVQKKGKSLGTLTIGGYGEAVYKYNFFSDNVFRYSHAANYTDSKGHGRVDLPHAVIMLGYDFGHGWSFNTEIEFEHGGTESAVEVEEEETGEFEKEIERGGEVALEQFWLQKAFWGGKMNIRAGHIVVPVGGTNNAHLPTQFFGVYRPEGENTIIPCTWHETGIEVWGRIQDWRYDVMLIPSLNSSMFSVSGWAHDGSASPYEFRVANKLAVAARVDNYSVKGLHIGISGFVGNTFMVNDLEAFRDSRSQSDLNKVCETFLAARAWWEKSEAFLFGAASDFGIDPHIDSWPLDVDAFNNLMNSPNMLAALAGEDGDVVAGEQLGNALLGFHGIEYILFNNGQPRNASEVTETQMVYAVAVAGDLRNRCFQLEVSWIGDAADKSHRDKVEELELNSTVNGGSYSYGDNLKKAGNPGSTYASSVMGLMAIVDGCKTIADEVGTSKIGKPYNGEDPNYIESPYSQKSIDDFYDNILSIQNAYYGGIEGQRNDKLSLHAYVKKMDNKLDNEVEEAIQSALGKINAMPRPFVSNYTNPKNAEAIEACQNLDDVLSKVNEALRTYEE